MNRESEQPFFPKTRLPSHTDHKRVTFVASLKAHTLYIYGSTPSIKYKEMESMFREFWNKTLPEV